MYKFVIDPGHGGADPGAVANGLVEKTLNLDLAKFLKTELERCGAEVILTRTRDDENPELYSRGQMALDNRALCFISIHFNAGGGFAKGFEAIYTITPSEQAASAQWIGQCVANEVEKISVPVRKVYTRESGKDKGQNYYGVLRASQGIAGLILEGMFLDNATDAKIIKQPDTLKNLAKAYAKGICTAYGWGYVEETAAPTPVVEAPKEVLATDWKTEAMKYLYDNGYLKSEHSPDEPMTMAVFAQIMKNKGW
jgi:N-acetylmuramoyl-L-alanine amidase